MEAGAPTVAPAGCVVWSWPPQGHQAAQGLEVLPIPTPLSLWWLPPPSWEAQQYLQWGSSKVCATCAERQGKVKRKGSREGGKKERKTGGWSFGICFSRHVYPPACSHTQTETHIPCMQTKEPGGEWRRRERERRQLQEAEPTQGAGIEETPMHAFHS